MPLHQDEHEVVALERWRAGADVTLRSPAGLELLVLDGDFTDGSDCFRYQSWLRLPPGSGVAILARGKEVLVPDARTVLRCGDQVLVVAALGQVTQVEERLRTVSRHGRLASWAA